MKIDWPSGNVFYPNNCTPILIDNARINASEETGTIQVVERPGMRWRFTVGWSAKRNVNMAAVHAKLSEGMGRVGTFGLFAFHRPRPLTTVTGVRVLATAVLQGGNEAEIPMPAGQNFSVGDWVTINGQMLCVTSSVRDSGVAIVRFSPRLKAFAAAGTTVFYEYARGNFRLLQPQEIKFEPKVSRGFTAQFEEVL